MARRKATHLADGRYQIKVTLPSGKRRSVYGHTPKEANDNADDLLTRARSGQPIPTGRHSLCQFLTGHREWPAKDPRGDPLPPAGWLGSVVKTGCRPTVYHRYEINCRVHIIPDLGRRQLAKLAAPEIQQFLADKLGEGLAPRTVKQMFAVLRNSLNVAVQWRLLPYNPCQGVRPPKVAKTRYTTVIGDEALFLLESVQGHSLECFVTLALTTGLREGELLGLRWQDVDMVRGLVMVRQQAQRVPHEGWHFPEPKSETSSRLVLLTDPGLAALARQGEKVIYMRALAGEQWEDHDLVHPNRLGRPIEKGNLLRRWKRFLTSQQMEEMTIHELRHSTATVLFSLGVELPIIQEILGHSSIGVTSDIYRGFVAPMHQSAVAKLNAFLLRRPAEIQPGVSSKLSSGLLSAPPEG